MNPPSKKKPVARKQHVRRGQLVLPFGVGAIVEVGQESYVCVDLSKWRPDEAIGVDPSDLQRMTGRQIRTPAKSAPFVRFPRWMFCPSCRRMRLLTEQREKELLATGRTTPRCPHCKKADLTPMGFVQACKAGHLDEIDWYRWCHRNAQAADRGQCERGTAELKFITTGARGGDWETLQVRCETCNAKNSLEGLTTRPLPWKCRGRQPWSHKDSMCEEKPFGHRRGDSNLYFPLSLSALDINADGAAPSSGLREYMAEQFETGQFSILKGLTGVFTTELLLDKAMPALVDLAAARGVPLPEMIEAFTSQFESKPSSEEAVPSDVALEQDAILVKEWPVLARTSDLVTDKLIINSQKPGPDWPAALADAVQRINLVPRLREVRGLLGYRRVDPSSGASMPLNEKEEAKWIPGVEVWGEGIFVQFREEYVASWEAQLAPALKARIKKLGDRYEATQRDRDRVTARFLALHTLSHALVRRLAFDAGYSSTALRERVYAGPDMAGILIYTADGDSEGSLGGLVRMGRPDRLRLTMVAALNDAAWCSADPVCSETSSQGVNGLNGAACHACSLVAETSCVTGNQLLDRHFLLQLGDGRMDHGLLPLPPVEEQP